MEWTTNALGRKIPVEIEGRKLRPFAGAHADSAPGGTGPWDATPRPLAKMAAFTPTGSAGPRCRAGRDGFFMVRYPSLSRIS